MISFATPADRADAGAFLGRAVRLDPGALVRLRSDGTAIGLWCWLPLEVLVSRAVRGSVAPADVSVSAQALLEAVQAAPVPPDAAAARLPTARDAEWRGALPPPRAGEPLDTIPGDVVGQLLAAARRAFRDASAAADPRAVGDALMEQDVLTVSSAGSSAGVQLRGLLALARMGFLGSEESDTGPMAVALVGGWVRLSSSYGEAYLRRGERLGLHPAT